MTAGFVVCGGGAAAWMSVGVTCSAADGCGRPLSACTLAEVQAAELGLSRSEFRAALRQLPAPCLRHAGGAGRLWQALLGVLGRSRGAFHRALLGERAYARYALEQVLCSRRGRAAGEFWIGLDGRDERSGGCFVLTRGRSGGLELQDSAQQADFAALLADAGRRTGYVYAPDEARAFLAGLEGRPDGGGSRAEEDGGAGVCAPRARYAFDGLAACGRGIYPCLQVSWQDADGSGRSLQLRLACRALPEDGTDPADDMRAWARVARRHGPHYFVTELRRRAVLTCSQWQVLCAGLTSAQAAQLARAALPYLTERSERYRVMFAGFDPDRVRGGG